MILTMWRVKSDNKEKKAAAPEVNTKLLEKSIEADDNESIKKFLEKMLKN